MVSKIISINDLKVGMLVLQITEQRTASVNVKNKGRVSNQSIIDELKKKGVKKLAIDPDDIVETELHCNQEELKVKEKQRVSLASELKIASSIHAKGLKLQQKLYESAERGTPFDESIPQEFTKALISSLDRNPDALLLLTRIREKDSYLLEHSLNVAILSANFSRFLGRSKTETESIAYAALLHDLGKIKIPDSILHKPGRLTDSEMEEMKKHVEYGVQFLEAMGIDKHRINVMSEHHERLDGKGYPAGKKGDEISYEGRMLAITDMYDALTADRCYKLGMSSQKALQILLKDSKTRLDSGLLQQFIKCMGVYPMGSLVALSNNKIALVMQQNENQPLKPVVKVIYSTVNNCYLPAKDIDLSKENTIKIDKGVVGSDYNIDINKFFKNAVLE